MSPAGGWRCANQDVIIDFWASFNKTKTDEVVKISSKTTAHYYKGGVNGNEVWHYKIKVPRHLWFTEDVLRRHHVQMPRLWGRRNLDGTTAEMVLRSGERLASRNGSALPRLPAHD